MMNRNIKPPASGRVIPAATGPVHSFAVPAYGDSPFLEECLLSLERQTVPSTVYIATSTPSPFLERAARRHGIPLLVNPERRGIAADWTFAYRQCATGYLTLAHQDDIYHPGYTYAVVNAAELSPDTLIAFTDYDELTDGLTSGRTVNLSVKKAILAAAFHGKPSLDSGRSKRRLLSLACVIPCPSVMFNKRLIGDFAFSPGYQINLDWDAWARLAERDGSFRYVPRRLMKHRIHLHTATAGGIEAGQRQREDRMMFRRFWPGPVAGLIARLYALSLRTRG